MKIYLLLFLILNTLRKNMPVKFWDYEQTFLQFMMQKPLIKKSLVTFGRKNHNTIKNKLEKGKKKSLSMYDVLSAGALLYCITTQLEKITNSLKRLLKRREKNRP